MKANTLFTIVILMLCWTVCSTSLQAQNNSSVEPSPINKVIKKEGWNIPNLLEKDSVTVEPTVIGEMPVTIKSYKLQKALDVKLDFYFLGAEKTLSTYSKEFEVNTIYAYVANNKVFAYQAVGTPFGYTEDKSKVTVGVIQRIYYLDQDGDGIFETRYQSLKFPSKVPDWVKGD